MPKLKWWLLIFLLIAVTGAMRFQARNSYAADVSNEKVLDRVKELILEKGLKISGEILDSDRESQLIGYKFRDSCQDDISVISFSINLVARSVVTDFATEQDAYRVHFYDHRYSESSRTALIAIWAKNLILTSLNLSSQIRSKSQIAVIWPKNCREPQLDWNSIWDQESNKGRKLAS